MGLNNPIPERRISMYRIVFKGVVITRGQATLERAEEVKKDLLARFFTDCKDSDLVIIDEVDLKRAND